jgi:hypothetical protein
VTDDNLYDLLNNILIDLEELFEKIDALNNDIDRFSSLAAQLTDKPFHANAIDAINIRKELLRASGMLLPEPRDALLYCINNLVHEEGKVDPFFHEKLDKSIGISKSLPKNYVEDMEALLDNVEPARSKAEINALYKRSDHII